MIPQKDWVRDLVIYQIYPRSFFDSNGDGVGDLPGVIAKLDYLSQLGVNALWLSPFFASPNDDNGYDISDYRAILPEFGTMADCDELIRQCHARGMKFILDLVVNHSSDEHEWFRKSVKREAPYTDYYYWRDPVDGHAPNNWASCFGGSAWEFNEERGQYYLHYFSKKQPDLNWSCPALKAEIHELIRWWKDRGVDGLRIDAISYLDKPADFPDAEGAPMPDGYVFPSLLTGRPGTHAYLHELNEKLFTPLNLMTVGEVSLRRDEELADYVSDERAEFDMAIPFLPPIAEYGQHIPTMLRDRLKTRYDVVPGGWWAQFMSNHDKPRQVSFFGNDGEFREVCAKALALVNHMSPGTPFVYQGEELGMTSIHLSSIDQYDDIGTHNDYRQRLLAGDSPEAAFKFAADLSRDNARTPMQWNASANAGFTTGTPWLKVNPNYVDVNAEAQMSDPLSVFHFYRRLIALRAQHPALRNGDLQMLDGGHADVIAFSRTAGGETLTLAANLSDAPHAAPQGLTGEILLQSHERESGFDGATLRPWEAVLFAAKG